MQSIKFREGGGKRREALGVDHKRLLYCVNVNRTSLDHLLLGESADIDKLSNDLEYNSRGEGSMTNFYNTTLPGPR
jgi:hypothetical protein